MFLSTHLHNPCLCRRRHDLSDNDNIMGLWLLGIHGQVVAHIRKDIRVVVPLYVLIVAYVVACWRVRCPGFHRMVTRFVEALW